MNNREYERPKVTLVTLNIDQSVLMVCKVGGDYFALNTYFGGTSWCAGSQQQRYAPGCASSVRGESKAWAGIPGSFENMPS